MCAVLWRTKQSMRHLAGKSTLTHAGSALNPCSLTLPIEELTVAPQKVAEVSVSDSTRDTYQRKVLYDSGYFIVAYYDTAIIDSTLYYYIKYVSSSDGISWLVSGTLWGGFTVPPYYGSNVDFALWLHGTSDIVFSVAKDASYSCYWYPATITDGTITRGSGGTLGSQTKPQGGNVCPNIDGYVYIVWHKDTSNRVIAQKNPAIASNEYITSLTHGGSTTGGQQVLPYETSSPYNMLVLAKDASDNLAWNILQRTDFINDCWLNNSFTNLVTLSSGFSTFCACSEALNEGDPEIIHLVYIKSTGELCYRKFENDEWGVEKVLVASGASYPVIASGKGGRLYVFYVKDGEIKLLKYNGASWGSEETLFPEHTYNNPTYLSSNQNVQNGQICLVWTEGTSSPYEVWFCTIGD